MKQPFFAIFYVFALIAGFVVLGVLVSAGIVVLAGLMLMGVVIGLYRRALGLRRQGGNDPEALKKYESFVNSPEGVFLGLFYGDLYNPVKPEKSEQMRDVTPKQPK